jgi:hypothetical protein
VIGPKPTRGFATAARPKPLRMAGLAQGAVTAPRPGVAAAGSLAAAFWLCLHGGRPRGGTGQGGGGMSSPRKAICGEGAEATSTAAVQ